MITKAEWKGIRGSQPAPDQIMISIKGDAAHAMSIRWRTDTTVNEDSTLSAYRKQGFDQEQECPLCGEQECEEKEQADGGSCGVQQGAGGDD